MAGHTGMVAWYPAADLIVVVLTSAGGVAADAVEQEVAAALLGIEAPAPIQGEPPLFQLCALMAIPGVVLHFECASERCPAIRLHMAGMEWPGQRVERLQDGRRKCARQTAASSTRGRAPGVQGCAITPSPGDEHPALKCDTPSELRA